MKTTVQLFPRVAELRMPLSNGVRIGQLISLHNISLESTQYLLQRVPSNCRGVAAGAWS